MKTILVFIAFALIIALSSCAYSGVDESASIINTETIICAEEDDDETAIYTQNEKSNTNEDDICYPITPVEIDEDIELIALLEKISGHWVDRNYYYSSIIDASVVYPQEFFVWNEPTWGNVSPPGFPIGPIDCVGMGIDTSAFFVIMHELEAGIVELIYDTEQPILWFGHGDTWHEEWTPRQVQIWSERRIVVDTINLPIQEIRYYIGDQVHHMVRFDPNHDPSRYTVEVVDDSVRIAWHLNQRSLPPGSDYSLLIYRSTQQGERGERIRESALWYWWDFEARSSTVYEFIDTNVEIGITYYYSLWYIDADGVYQSILIGDVWQMSTDGI